MWDLGFPNQGSNLCPSLFCVEAQSPNRWTPREIPDFLFYIKRQWIYNTVWALGVQQSGPLYTRVHPFTDSFPFMSLQDVGLSSLRFTAGPCWLPILNTAVGTSHSQTPGKSASTTLCVLFVKRELPL